MRVRIGYRHSVEKFINCYRSFFHLGFSRLFTGSTSACAPNSKIVTGVIGSIHSESDAALILTDHWNFELATRKLECPRIIPVLESFSALQPG